jgi:hypothetical protein
MASAQLAPFSLERMVRAVDKVRERLLRAASALEAATVPYAVAGGNADILLSRESIEAATRALEAGGFVRRHVAGVEMFLDGAQGKARDAVHIVFAGEKVRTEYPFPAPDVTESEKGAAFRVVNLEALVRMKLTSFRDRDRVHLRDLIEVGLVDATWLDRLHPQLSERLRTILDSPEG